MSFRFTCENCGAELKAPDSLANGLARCPKCKKRVSLPKREKGQWKRTEAKR